MLTPPTLRDVFEARKRIAGVVRPTPLFEHPLLAAELGLDVYVKHENHNPTGAFKVRGGINLVASLDERPARAGRDHGLDGQPRPVDRVRLPPRRRAVHDPGAARQQPREERRHARVRRHRRGARTGLRRGAGAGRGARRRAGAALRALGERAAAHRRRRHLRAGDLRGAARGRRRDRARRRRQRGERRRHGPRRAGGPRRGDWVSRRRAPTRSRARGGVRRAWWGSAPTRSPRASPPA